MTEVAAIVIFCAVGICAVLLTAALCGFNELDED